MTSRDLRALVVEDDASWGQLLVEILTDTGFQVDLADNVESAVEEIRRKPHRLAVLDLSLAGRDHRNQDGLHVMEAIRRHDPGCVSLFLTGYATVELAVSLIQEYGAYTCLRKESFRRSAFRDLINQALTIPPSRSQVQGTTSSELHTNTSPAGLGLDKDDVQEEQSWQALVVEDDAGWRNLLHELLVDAGYRVHQSRSYVEALGLMKHASFDLAIVDLSLASSLDPEENLDGYRLLASTQEANLPTIVVSGYADPERIEQAYNEHNIFACLEKQAFDRAVFLQTVQRAQASRIEDPVLANLTHREKEVLALLARGYKNKEIASALYVTPNTVKRHLKSIFEKLDVRTRAAASAKAISSGLDVNP
jgi:DNA-binding NarL/FixJ family response regulator